MTFSINIKYRISFGLSGIIDKFRYERREFNVNFFC